ncbi:hypothetical protein PENSPDRAFT_60759 [Peniophora sp. CONT]|nr:hypothetical protein PENSPDRAFT_60759 [Peniophora sp. CONT]
MYAAHHLPRSLLLLLLAWPLPLLAAAPPSTPNDPFRDIAIQTRKPPEEPICCLRPLTPLEPVDEDLLLSFEEWKSRQLADGQQAPVPDFSAPPNLSGATILNGNGEATSILTPPAEGSASSAPPTDAPEGGFGLHATPEPLSPHFRIPLTDRFNYASLDCSARVHTAHRGAKSAHNILSNKKDRYMLSPCGDRPQFIVAELCDDIWIDTVQLANYEFFSGVFKDFTVSVAKQYEVESSGWTVAGTYTAKNVRGVQSFHPPKSLRDFYRFIRIDFHSHYGSEYYCPISLLRVYGLTHLEQWKWELWENESRAKARALEAQEQAAASIAPPVEAADPPQPAPTPNIVEQESTPTVLPPVSTPMITLEAPPSPEPEETSRTFRHSTDIANGVGDSSLSPSPTPESTPFEPTPTIVNASDTAIRTEPTISSPPPSSDPSSTSTSASASETKTISLAPVQIAPVQFGSTGESIYRTIMNRLSALEANTTLYARYVSSQTGAMHDALRRLHEELGRLESLGRAQSQAHERALTDLERERRRLEAEQRALALQAAALAHDVALEKYLGVAQLCLLLAVLVFLSLTRGAGESPAAVRAWGKRNLSLRSDWVQRLRSRSLTPAPEQDSGSGSGSVPFPSSQSQRPKVIVSPVPQRPKLPRIELDDTPLPSYRRSTRTGTPVRRHPHAHIARTPVTPTGSARPGLARSASHSSTGLARSTSHSSASGGGLMHPPTIGPMPRSVKKWARSAHLHEVRPRGSERVVGNDASGRMNGGEGEKVVLKGSVWRKEAGKGKGREIGSVDENGEGWVDTDSDGDTVPSVYSGHTHMGD